MQARTLSIASLVLLVAGGLLLPGWAVFLVTIALAKGLVVLGLMVLWRSGLVSFGQALYFGSGAYAAGLAGHYYGVGDMFALIAMGTVTATALSFVLGFLLSRYRDIFFAMLSLAFSMILYGLLVKTEALGSTDGFNMPEISLLGLRPEGEGLQTTLYAIACVSAVVAAMLVHRYLDSPLGRMGAAIRDNELRVEYLGYSVRRAIHLKYVAAAALAGTGGAITALAVGHIDPEMTYWTTSGEFVFVTILSGTQSVIAPFLGSLLFELVRTYASEYAPNTWQMVLGGALLAIILFLPDGLWSLARRLRREPGSESTT